MAVKSTQGKRTRSAKPAPQSAGMSNPAPGPEPGAGPDFLASQRAAGLAVQATLFIQQAATVLEREVAAGISAAQTLEKRFLDVDGLRSRAPDEVMQRFRRDAHEVIDIVMDLLATGVRSVEGVAQRAIRISQTIGGDGSAPNGGEPKPDVPTLSPEGATPPGTTATLEMALENASDDAREVVGFQASDLIAHNGERIASTFISFAPLPVAIAPHGKAKLMVSIAVPADAKPGVYSGLMMAKQMEQVRALIAVSVEASA